MHNRNVCNNYLTLIVQKYVVKIQDVIWTTINYLIVYINHEVIK